MWANFFHRSNSKSACLRSKIIAQSAGVTPRLAALASRWWSRFVFMCMKSYSSSKLSVCRV